MNTEENSIRNTGLDLFSLRRDLTKDFKKLIEAYDVKPSEFVKSVITVLDAMYSNCDWYQFMTVDFSKEGGVFDVLSELDVDTSTKWLLNFILNYMFNLSADELELKERVDKLYKKE